MPDVDLMPLHLGREWRSVLNLLTDGGELDDVAQATARAVAGGLKRAGGVPCLADIAEGAHVAARQTECQLDLGLALPRAVDLGRTNVPTMIAAEAAAVLSSDRAVELAATDQDLVRHLAAAGRSDVDATADYRTQEPTEAARDPLSAMRWQVSRLRRCFDSHDPWPALVAEFPQVGTVSSRLSAESLTRLYQTYLSEWEDPPPLFGTARGAERSVRDRSGASIL